MVRRTKQAEPKQIMCAIYTRKSTDEGLDSDFNSLDNQREKAEAFIKSQEGWVAVDTHYDDGGHTGAHTDRPALQQLLTDMEAGRFDCIVVYRSDRMSRSILDFLRLLERMEKAEVAYVSVTEAFSTKTPAGRLMMHLLLSFAEYERELVSERTKHKIAGAKRKGQWCGGSPILGYDVVPEGGRLVVNEAEAEQVRGIFRLYLKHGSLIPTVQEVNRRGWTSKRWTSKKGVRHGGAPWLKNTLHHLLTNMTYTGRISFQGEVYEGEHDAIIDDDTWDRVQRKLQLNSRNNGSTQRNRYGALLRGLLYCAACGKSMTHAQSARGSRRYRYYRCSSAEKMGAASCPTGSLPAAEIERFVVDEIRCIGIDEAVIHETLKAVREDGEQIRETDLRQALASFDPIWNELTGVEQAKVVRLLVDRVTYDRADGTVAITFRPTGIRSLAAEAAG